MQIFTGRQTDGRRDDASSRSYYAEVRSAKNSTRTPEGEERQEREEGEEEIWKDGNGRVRSGWRAKDSEVRSLCACILGLTIKTDTTNAVLGF